MEEENNPAFISNVPDSNTVQDDVQISTDDGLYMKLPVLNSIVNKTELNDKNDVDNHEEPTIKNHSSLPIIKVENDCFQDSTKVIHTKSDSGKVGRELCHYNMEDRVTPDKLHNCLICTKSFTCVSALTRHVRKHTAEKPNVASVRRNFH